MIELFKLVIRSYLINFKVEGGVNMNFLSKFEKLIHVGKKFFISIPEEFLFIIYEVRF
jgi:hypothetical protein